VRPGTDDSETWIEIRSAASGAAVRSWRQDVRTSGLAWSPDGRYVSYVAATPGTQDANRSTLYLLDMTDGTTLPLLDRLERLGGYDWSPDGSLVVYGITEEAEKDERGVKRLEGLMDRWAGFRDKSHLNLVTVPEGVRRRITAGGMSTSARAFSPDGGKLLFTRQVDDVSARPYSRTELWELELNGLTATRLRDFRWLSGVSYSPDGERLLVATCAGEFGESGLNLPAGAMPNSYDTQLFVWDPQADVADAITRDFDPAVSSSVWSRHDGRIYVRATDRDRVRLFRYDDETRSFDPLDTGFEVLRRFSLAEKAPLAVGFGSSAWTPQGLVAIDLEGGGSRRLEHPAGDWFADVEPGAVEPWDFETSTGITIDGRIYYPPGFDRTKRYPCLVYYYGGTSPVTSEFGGRYPKDWWAANGYVVYVMQPSGAYGFGQDFSAVHVNDWGETASEEIIEGTRKFLEAHPYVDPERVGCLGASYGGFMTMLLATKTDLFAAAVSHAGISSIASYWGEGYWGYAYSSVATADSFPWNRRDVYVDRSPLFRADQLRVPILLTHGRSDTNVPVGESDAFYIAAKLLGKEIEYVQVEGQDHFIMDHAKRLVWSRTIVAWFDRWLKDQPEWWYDLYPDPDKSESDE
jgi:dipeptidyl aminopeptidase/acylaminoacyl peptidase